MLKEIYGDKLEAKYCIRCGSKLRQQPDSGGKLRLQCPSCGWVHYRNPVPAVAVVALNEKSELLLINRKYEPKAGQWALPSGYLEINLTPEENALQELEEETGLKGEIMHCIGWHYGSSPVYSKILSIGFRVRLIGGVLTAGDDAADARFVPLGQLPEIAFASHKKFINIETGLNLQ